MMEREIAIAIALKSPVRVTRSGRLEESVPTEVLFDGANAMPG